jgi:hypothetical protein|tara:strand:+ start:473 stop:982 length:510 start_codon:yes stop_codon:yes gene_type:complete
MAGRRSRYAQVDSSSLITGGIVVFDGTGLSCPGLNTIVIDDHGNLKLKGKVIQSGSVTHLKNVHKYALKETDTTILIDSQQGEVTLTLPKITGLNAYQEYVLKDSAGYASKCNIVVQTHSPIDKIEGGHAIRLRHDYGMVRLLTDGTQWLVMSEMTQRIDPVIIYTTSR